MGDGGAGDGGCTSSDRVRPALGVGPACGMGYGGGLGSIDGTGAGGTPAVPGDTKGETEGLGLGLGSVVGKRLRSGISSGEEGWVKGAEGFSKVNKGSGKWSKD